MVSALTTHYYHAVNILTDRHWPSVGLLTREYPPEVYGGGGVHVENLARWLGDAGADVRVQCLGAPRPGSVAHSERDQRLGDADPVLHILAANVAMAAAAGPVDVVHSHTWYTNLAGRLVQLLYGTPHVVTAHSLEPQRPWKAEQLGGGYRISSWAERSAYETADAVVAVSQAMRRAILACYPSCDPERVVVIPNGVDTDAYRPDPDTDFLQSLGLDLDRPYIAFVGRTSRQKGIDHLLHAAEHLDPRLQLLLVLGAADTPALATETAHLAQELRKARRGAVHTVARMLPPELVRQVLSHAAVFCCPSVYEPQGIVNLEAMACGTAVVASDVGGIPDVVMHGETGLLVHHDPAHPDRYQRDLAAALNTLATDPAQSTTMGRAGRERAITRFSWPAAARATLTVYNRLLGR